MAVADITRVYLKNRPYIMEALERRIVNVSALARVVQHELGIKNYQAVKAAIRRYSGELQKRKNSIEMRALSVLNENSITLLDGIEVIIANARLGIENDAEVKVDSFYIYLTRRHIGATTNRQEGKIIRAHEHCSAIVITSSERIERVSGVVAFLTSVLAEEGVNIIEFISCYTKTIIVINKEDALRTYQLLSEIIHPASSDIKPIKK